MTFFAYSINKAQKILWETKHIAGKTNFDEKTFWSNAFAI